MKKTECLSMILLSLEYVFTKPDIDKVLISVSDDIQIQKIDRDIVVLHLIRVLDYGPETGSFIKVTYELAIKGSKEWNKNSIRQYCNSDAPEIQRAYAKISLLLSDITNESPFGVMVTPPILLAEKTNSAENDTE